jgi:hypothetical protein
MVSGRGALMFQDPGYVGRGVAAPDRVRQATEQHQQLSLSFL